jgi:hypothetical protein
MPSYRANPVYRAIAAVLDQHRIAYVLVHGGRHDSICFDYGGRALRVILPQSPSDRRAPVNARAFVRRLLRQTQEIRP